jgi:hypothetical protein
MENLPTLAVYRNLSEENKTRIESILREYCLKPGLVEAFRESLKEFGDDAILIFLMVNGNVKQQNCKEGMWGALVNVLAADKIIPNIPLEASLPPPPPSLPQSAKKPWVKGRRGKPIDSSFRFKLNQNKPQ